VSSYIFETASTDVCVSSAICSTTLSSLGLFTLISSFGSSREKAEFSKTNDEVIAKAKSSSSGSALREVSRAQFKLAFLYEPPLTQIKADRFEKYRGMNANERWRPPGVALRHLRDSVVRSGGKGRRVANRRHWPRDLPWLAFSFGYGRSRRERRPQLFRNEVHEIGGKVHHRSTQGQSTQIVKAHGMVG